MSVSHDTGVREPRPFAANAGESPTPESIMQLAFGFEASKALLSAVELGVFGALAAGPLDAHALGVKVGLHPRGAYDFLDALVSLDLLAREDGRYSNTPTSSLFLDPGKPSYIGAMLELCNDRLYADWHHLSEALRTGRPCREYTADEDHFTTIYKVDSGAQKFAQAMTGVGKGVGQAIARQFPWSSYQTFADVGCAEGGMTVEIARTHGHLSGIGLDLPPVGPVFEAYVAASGLADRLRFQTGDIFKDGVPTVDVVLLGHMLHGLDLDGKRTLIGKAYAALPKGGAVIIVDMVIDDERRRNVPGLLMSLNMLIETPGGFDYTGAECLGWLAEAGFNERRIEPLAGPHSMVIGIK